MERFGHRDSWGGGYLCRGELRDTSYVIRERHYCRGGTLRITQGKINLWRKEDENVTLQHHQERARNRNQTKGKRILQGKLERIIN